MFIKKIGNLMDLPKTYENKTYNEFNFRLDQLSKIRKGNHETLKFN